MASILKGQSGQPISFEVKPQVNGDDVLTRPEIVGTVSESGGVPTGAIIQRGSNANGEFVMYADGTLINLFTHGFDPFTAEQIKSAVKTYPSSFVAGQERYIFVNGSRTTAAWFLYGTFNFGSESFVEIYAQNIFPGNQGAIGVNILAIGRWY